MSMADTTAEAFANTRPSSADGVPDHFGRQWPRRAHTKETTMIRDLRVWTYEDRALMAGRPIGMRPS
jgi:hypothetical protein